ncbi:hypothetical protein [Rhodococcus opacus]|uniref:hypothetical protein n=1 Tax=Rhodococcus opacus TaxID=37919 RepID=UPI00247401DC|nr:hypothetical protein [Rhodococcus opacus]MDH6291308.1 hypothetical protein [Rhodococcus opacus]
MELDAAVAGTTGLVKSVPPCPRSAKTFLSEITSEPPEDGSALDHYSSCPVSGQENPLGSAVAVRREGLDVVASAVFDIGLRKYPQCRTAARVCAVFDEVRGYVFTTMKGKTGYTATMTVDFTAPIRIGSTIEFLVPLAKHEGRKTVPRRRGLRSGSHIGSERASVVPRGRLRVDRVHLERMSDL